MHRNVVKSARTLRYVKHDNPCRDATVDKLPDDENRALTRLVHALTLLDLQRELQIILRADGREHELVRFSLALAEYVYHVVLLLSLKRYAQYAPGDFVYAVADAEVPGRICPVVHVEQNFVQLIARLHKTLVNVHVQQANLVCHGELLVLSVLQHVLNEQPRFIRDTDLDNERVVEIIDRLHHLLDVDVLNSVVLVDFVVRLQIYFLPVDLYDCPESLLFQVLDRKDVEPHIFVHCQ